VWPSIFLRIIIHVGSLPREFYLRYFFVRPRPRKAKPQCPHDRYSVSIATPCTPHTSCSMLTACSRSVYFNPAKTAGAMLEADLFCLIGVLFSAFISLSSSFSIRLFEDDPDHQWIGDCLVFIWVACAMSIVSWAKVWVNKPSFNTATSMTSIILFIV
jgi:hypothetical protein